MGLLRLVPSLDQNAEGAIKFYLAMAAYFVLLLYPATFTLGPQAAIAVTLFWCWIFKSEGRGWGQTAAGIAVLLPGLGMWRRGASPRFEEPGANGVQG